MKTCTQRLITATFQGLILGLGATLFLPKCAAAADAPQKELPTFSQIQRHVRAHLQSTKGYQPGDLLTKTQVQPVFAALATLGWKVAEVDEILELVCDDQDALVRHLRSPQGAKLMRAAGKDTAVYNRLHRLTMTDGGPAHLRDMLKLPNGVEVAKALTNDPRGKDIARRLSRSPKAPDFDKPTGLIYTEAQLIDRLRTSYTKATKKPPKQQ
ncbi:MAG: hypothetical protein WD176_06555 [Pirellulales bacterium]